MPSNAAGKPSSTRRRAWPPGRWFRAMPLRATRWQAHELLPPPPPQSAEPHSDKSYRLLLEDVWGHLTTVLRMVPICEISQIGTIRNTVVKCPHTSSSSSL